MKITVYGLDAGQKKKSAKLVRLVSEINKDGTVTSRQLTEVNAIEVHVGSPPVTNDKDEQRKAAGVRAKAIAAALQKGDGCFPLAIDAALTCAKSGQGKRLWEGYARAAYPTPEWKCLSATAGWPWISMVWIQVAASLVKSGSHKLWCGKTVGGLDEKNWLAEVYPRVSWATAMASTSKPLAHPYLLKEITFRGHVLQQIEPQPNALGSSSVDLHDAAIAALTMERVMLNKARYLGEDHVDLDSVISGGGIATF